MDLDTLYRSLQMVLGIGLVIFVHELGHFIAARMCRVRVDVFSLGFGPKLLGWRRGETLYQVALLPIGGFVRMAGEDPSQQDARPRPDELRAKTVGQRFFIYSGGVLMNMLFGVVVMPLILFSGVAFDEPVIGAVEPGGGAWKAGLEPGTRVLEVNGSRIASFEYIAQEIALGSPESAELLVLAPRDSEPRLVRVEPRYDERLGMNTIGVYSGSDLGGAIVVAPDSAASAAGLTSEDRILAIEGAVPELPLDDQILSVLRYAEPLRMRVANAQGNERSVVVAPRWSDSEGAPVFGVSPAANFVSDLRENADLAALGLRQGDRLVAVNGRRILREGDFLAALLASNEPVRMLVERGQASEELAGPALDRRRALALARDVALESNKKQCEIALSVRAPAADVLQDGDRLLAVNGVELVDWDRDFLPIARGAAADGQPIQLRVARRRDDGSLATLDVTANAGVQPRAEYGFARREALYTFRAQSIGEAVSVGLQATWKFATDAWMMVKRMVLGQVSSKHMGGIISIGVVAYSWAELGIAKLLFFLCMLSVNLAFINVLPVPLLDGGHLLFLLIEKIKGSPVSERVFGYSQVVGLVLILTLLIYVTYNDVMRVTTNGP
jgi:regulator of sigma E protease